MRLVLVLIEVYTKLPTLFATFLNQEPTEKKQHHQINLINLFFFCLVSVLIAYIIYNIINIFKYGVRKVSVPDF